MSRTTAFNKIKAGLEDAIAYVKGDTSKGKIVTEEKRDPRNFTSLDDLLDEDGIREEVIEAAMKRVEEDRFDLPPHVQRLYIEADELHDRIGKLTSFVADNPLFEKLSAEEQNLLRIQSAAMMTYSSVLLARLTLIRQSL
jgi:hypothetical protein